MACPICPLTRESNVGRSVKKPGGPARILCEGVITSIGFKNTGGTISDRLATHIEGVVPLTSLVKFGNVEEDSINCVCTEDDEEFGIKAEDIE